MTDRDSSSQLNNIELIRNMTNKYKLPFKLKKLLHLGKKSVFLNRYYKYFKNEQNDILSNNKCLIIGGGPSGLRLAIELSLYGHTNVQIIDCRDHWSRKQIVAIWNITESDLISLGIRDLLPKFTKNPQKKSIPITFIQHFLLRIALLLGVNIKTNIQFKSIDSRKNILNFYNKNTNKLEQIANDFDIIIDATGTVGALRDCPIITNKDSDSETSEDDIKEECIECNDVLIGSRKASHLKKDMYGIVANFKRVTGDHKLPQILGKSYHFYQREFDSKDIKLENIVYYRSDLTNYLVATVKKQSLIGKNVFVNGKLKGKQLLNKQNINGNNLREMILSVANEWNVPHSRKRNPFNILTNGNDDFAVLEFGKLKVAKQLIKFMKRYGNKYQMIACIGDAECVNHAFIGVYLMVDWIKYWIKHEPNMNDSIWLRDIEIKSKKEFDVLGDTMWHKKRIGHKYVPEYVV